MTTTPKPYIPQTLSDLLTGPTDIDWIVEDIIPPQTSGLLAGEGGVGKTWLMLELALAVATGTPWLGKFPTRQGTVLVVDEENAELMLRIRVMKMLEGRNLKPDIPLFFLIGEGINLTPIRGQKLVPSASFNRLLTTIEVLKPTLTLFDSLTRVHSSNENAAPEMAEIFRCVRHLLDTTGTSCLFSHHMRKMGSSKSGDRIRGTTDLRNFADYTVLVDSIKGKKGMMKVQHDKSRWSEPIPTFNVKLEVESTWAKLTHDGAATSTMWEWLERFLTKAKDHKATRQVILDAAAIEGFTEWKIDKKLREWANSGKLIKIGTNRKVNYRLPTLLDLAMQP